MKKVLFVIMHLEMGGAEKSLVNLLNELPANEMEVDVLLIKRRGVLLKQVPDWVNIIETPYELRSLFGFNADSMKGILLAALRVCGTICTKLFVRNNRRLFYRWTKFYSNAIPLLEKQYDVAVSYLPDECMYYVAEKVCADKKICWIHTDLLALDVYEKEYHHYFQYFNKVVTISQQCVNSIYSVCDEAVNKVQCLPNIVSGKYIRAKAAEEIEQQIFREVFPIISVGRLEHVKGFDMAIKAAAILKERRTNFHWYIIGEGSERENLEKLIAQNGLEHHVTLLGLKENPYPYIKNCNLVVQTSRFEGKSIAVDEAKILGIPILATNYATVRDQISPNEGWIVGMSPEEIADGILYVIQNPEELQNIKQYLLAHEYGNTEVIKDYLECLGI